MGMKYLWDTNIAIYFLQGQLPAAAEKFTDAALWGERAVLSAITEIELLCWKTANPKDLEILNNFIKDSVVIELEEPIKYKTAEIRKAQKIKLPDAIIAATAIVYDLTLLTRNTADFRQIAGLTLVNPWNP